MSTHLVNPRRACARVTVVVLCVCVPALAASASVEDSKQRYSRVSLRLFLDFDSWIFEKPFRSKVIARKSQYYYYTHQQRCRDEEKYIETKRIIISMIRN